MDRQYYEAYDDRYRQIHELNLQWFDDVPSGIVGQTIEKYGIIKECKLLEIGCGEGRDAFTLLDSGHSLLATDVSPEAIDYCRKKRPEFAEHFQTLDCVKDTLSQKFDFIYAVAVLHMLVPDADRNAFYRFIRNHLKENGVGLICTMGDGTITRQTDIQTAFQLQERIHEQTGKPVKIASTSCRMVTFDAFRQELRANRLAIIQDGITESVPGFCQMMYAVVKAC